ncbi:hypothetical protein [Chondromyces crocatus]|uniref:Uncharacterized protein n=1 Tax=Chondromyces crocatus TaxID=52 RepID=A0A0K1EG18_CHOCO|nr:hypothetical protein [Chondromyces crocatus]AKT39528.1 uncharacterized protein CMC5_036750 [Chondromyces crocatus]
MVALPREQVESLRRAQCEEFAEEVEAFLRRHFEARLRPCSSDEVRAAVQLGIELGEAQGLTLRGEVRIYLACACVCGLFLFEDPRCAWMFHEQPTLGAAEAPTNFAIQTLARNVGEVTGFFVDDALAGFEEAVSAAEREVYPARDEAGPRSSAGMKRALLTMNPARARFVGAPDVDAFLHVARAQAERLGLEGEKRTRYVLLAWLFGVRFVEDPLCKPAVAFLHAKGGDEDLGPVSGLGPRSLGPGGDRASGGDLGPGSGLGVNRGERP